MPEAENGAGTSAYLSDSHASRIRQPGSVGLTKQARKACLQLQTIARLERPTAASLSATTKITYNVVAGLDFRRRMLSAVQPALSGAQAHRRRSESAAGACASVCQTMLLAQHSLRIG